MANISRLLADRNGLNRQGAEVVKTGNVFYHSFTDTQHSRCQFCWISPGTGVAVIELWGASGSGGRMCCCSQSGIPGNSGAYSRKTVTVTASSFVCGWVGCAAQATALCYPGRSQCSIACPFNTSNNTVMNAQGGFGGFTNCTTSTGQFFCLRCACLFCSTDQGGGCGIVCNIGGPNGAAIATASGGDINVAGGFSCTRNYCCLNCGIQNSAAEVTIAIAPGIYSLCGPTCVQFHRNSAPTLNGGVASTGRNEMNIALNSLSGVMPNMQHCWAADPECGCYEFQGCYYGGVGIPGLSGHPCGEVRANGARGGHGAVKVTFYST